MHNGPMGRIVGLLSKGENLAPHEAMNSLIERAALGAERQIFGERLSKSSLESSKSPRNAVIIEPKLFKDRYALPVVIAHALAIRKPQSLTLP